MRSTTLSQSDWLDSLHRIKSEQISAFNHRCLYGMQQKFIDGSFTLQISLGYNAPKTCLCAMLICHWGGTCSQIVICLKDNRGMVGLPTALSLVWVNTGKPVSHVPKTLGAVVFREGTVHKVPSTWDATIGVSARETSWTDSTLSLLLPPHQGRREAQEEYLWEGISSLSYSLWHPQDTNFGIWLRES